MPCAGEGEGQGNKTAEVAEVRKLSQVTQLVTAEARSL